MLNDRVVFISARVVKGYGGELRDCLSHEWHNLFHKHRIVPIMIPNNLEGVSHYWDIGLNPVAVILAGGNNIVQDSMDDAYEERDLVEAKLIEICIEKSVPLLGVCRGMHMINKHFSGSVVAVDKLKHVAQIHKIESRTKDTILINEPLMVNSYHEYGIDDTHLGKDLIPICYSEDGIIEMIVHSDYKIMGIQWHPERKEEGFTKPVLEFMDMR